MALKNAMDVRCRVCFSFLQKNIETFLGFELGLVQLSFDVTTVFVLLGFAPRFVLEKLVQG